MRILFITKSVPFPLDQGANIRNYNLIRNLSAYHQIYLLTLARSADEESQAKHLENLCSQVRVVRADRVWADILPDLFRTTAGTLPYTVLANTVAALKAAAFEMVAQNRIELIQLQELYLAGNVALTKSTVPIVLDAFNAEGRVLRLLAASTKNPVRRLWYRAQAVRMEKYERQVAGAVDGVWSVSSVECRHFRSLNPNTFYVPNGVDIPNSAEAAAPPRREKAVLFTGLLQYPPNLLGLLWFLQEIWPRLNAAKPELKFNIVARLPPRAVRRFESSTVSFHDSVNDIAPFFASASALVVPLLAGAGTRLKILQAFASGLPVISTSAGVEGIEALDNEHLLIRDSASEFATGVIKLLDEPEYSARLSENGLNLVRERYEWPKAISGALECYRAFEQLNSGKAAELR